MLSKKKKIPNFADALGTPQFVVVMMGVKSLGYVRHDPSIPRLFSIRQPNDQRASLTVVIIRCETI